MLSTLDSFDWMAMCFRFRMRSSSKSPSQVDPQDILEAERSVLEGMQDTK